jgi:hypothetical protein
MLLGPEMVFPFSLFQAFHGEPMTEPINGIHLPVILVVPRTVLVMCECHCCYSIFHLPKPLNKI